MLFHLFSFIRVHEYNIIYRAYLIDKYKRDLFALIFVLRPVYVHLKIKILYDIYIRVSSNEQKSFLQILKFDHGLLQQKCERFKIVFSGESVLFERGLKLTYLPCKKGAINRLAPKIKTVKYIKNRSMKIGHE